MVSFSAWVTLEHPQPSPREANLAACSLIGQIFCKHLSGLGSTVQRAQVLETAVAPPQAPPSQTLTLDWTAPHLLGPSRTPGFLSWAHPPCIAHALPSAGNIPAAPCPAPLVKLTPTQPVALCPRSPEVGPPLSHTPSTPTSPSYTSSSETPGWARPSLEASHGLIQP